MAQALGNFVAASYSVGVSNSYASHLNVDPTPASDEAADRLRRLIENIANIQRGSKAS